MPEVFRIIPARNSTVPILVSVPHCATAFPDELVDQYNATLIESPDDTDWFVDKLYDFVPDLGITIIAPNYSRWVIDLNRDPESKPLYTDGRIITALCPTTTFKGEAIYNDGRRDVDKSEVQRRLEIYYRPYHQKILELLTDLKEKFGKALLWDCHSIRQTVPSIQKEKFPDLILGDADGTSASPGLSESALGVLDHSQFSVSHNFPFKGGYITRSFGRPAENLHALQLEMTKVHYMDAAEMNYDTKKADVMRELLRKVFLKLREQL